MCVISTCMISLSSNHFHHFFCMKSGLLRFMINLMWLNFHDKFISSQPLAATLSKPVCHSPVSPRFEMMLQTEHVD